MSPLIEQLLSALDSGVLTRFGELPPEQLEALKAEFSGTFDDEQRVILAGLVFDATGEESTIASINQQNHVNQMGVVQLADHTPVLPVSLITWAWPGEGFAPAYDLLLTLPVRRVTATDWPVSSDL